MENRQPEFLQYREHALPVAGWQQTHNGRIHRIQRDTDGHRFAMQHLKMGELLQFVGTPMPEIQGPRRTEFKGVRSGNVLEMQFGAPENQVIHVRAIGRASYRESMSRYV